MEQDAVTTSVLSANGHRRRGRILDFAREFAANGDLGDCRECSTPWRIFLRQKYPKYGEGEYRHEVVKAIRLHSPELVEEDHYDPFLFVVKAVGDNVRAVRKGKRIFWFPYWTYDRKQRWAFGQYPAMVNEDLFLAGLRKLEGGA